MAESDDGAAIPAVLKAARRALVTSTLGGCATLAAGMAILGASFALLWTTDRAPAAAAATPAEPEVEPTPGSLAMASFAFTGETGGDVAPTFRAGQPVRYRLSVAGLTPDPSGEWSLRLDLQVVAPSGVRVVEGTVLQDKGTAAGAIPVRGVVELSSWAPPGTYAMTFKIEDKVSAAELAVKQSFTLQ